MTLSDDRTKRFSSPGDGNDDAITLRSLFRLVQSVDGEVKNLRSDFDQYKIRTTPLGETLEAIRVDVKAVAERQDGFGKEMIGMRGEITGMRGEITGMRGEITGMRGEITEMRGDMAEMKRVIRRVETKLDGFSILLPEMQGTLHDHAVRLEALESK